MPKQRKFFQKKVGKGLFRKSSTKYSNDFQTAIPLPLENFCARHLNKDLHVNIAKQNAL